MCTMLNVVLVGLLLSTGNGEDSTERPAMVFCESAGSLLEVAKDTIDFFKMLHTDPGANPGDGNMAPLTLGNTTFKLPFATIYEGELYNAQNIYVNDSSRIHCDENQMNVKLRFGITDAVLKSKFKTPFGIDGDSTVHLSQFEGEVDAVLPRTSNRIVVNSIRILKLEDVVVDMNTDSKINLNKIANQFLTNTPKKVLYPIMEALVKHFVQQYLDENPLPI